MATTQLAGNPVALTGDFPIKDAVAKNFTAVQQDLSEISSESFKGKKMVLNIFPSIDTDVCATSVRKFNERGFGRRRALERAYRPGGYRGG